jgi:CheY-like chemotaxis protein
MPGESGPELAHRLRSRWPSLRVIFMSGYADDLNTGRWRVVPPSHYLQKPFTPGDLRSLVAEVMASPAVSSLLYGSFDSES